jgi:TolB protein
MTGTLPRYVAVGMILFGAVVAGQRPQQQQQAPASPPAQRQQPSELTFTINGTAGAAARIAVPPFIALTNDPETTAIARTIAEVLSDDLAFEREFLVIPRDVYASVPAPTSPADVPFDRWREVNADGVIIGTVQKTAEGLRVEAALHQVRTRRPAFTREYTGPSANPRAYAHIFADDLHQQQRGLRGVARTKLTFSSDRDGARIPGTVENRGVKEIYISDYDGENPRAVTTGRSLNIMAAWSPDARSIAYTSYRSGPPQILVSNIFLGTLEEITRGPGQSWLPAWSPDGAHVAFSSTRDGHPQIYIADRDGSNVRRLTNGPTVDTTPTWSPAPYNEIAFAARTGPGHDIKVIDLATNRVTQLTFSEGTNESPAYSANGRHIAFMSTRSGKSQIFTMARDGKDVRQVTKAGNNFHPDWSK